MGNHTGIDRGWDAEQEVRQRDSVDRKIEERSAPCMVACEPLLMGAVTDIGAEVPNLSHFPGANPLPDLLHEWAESHPHRFPTKQPPFLRGIGVRPSLLRVHRKRLLAQHRLASCQRHQAVLMMLLSRCRNIDDVHPIVV